MKVICSKEEAHVHSTLAEKMDRIVRACIAFPYSERQNSCISKNSNFLRKEKYTEGNARRNNTLQNQ